VEKRPFLWYTDLLFSIFMSGNPGHNPQELFLRAVRELETAIPGLEQELRKTNGVVSPQLSAFLGQVAAKSPAKEVRDRISFILNYSNAGAPHSQALSTVQKKDETGRFERVLPLPNQAVEPEGLSPKTPPPPSGETASLGALQQKLQELIQANPKNFVQTFLVPAFAGKFDQLKFIAKGGMGMIVKGQQLGLNRDVAIKLNTQMIDQLMVQSFVNEGKHAAQLGFDPNVVAVIETNQVKIALGNRQISVPYHVLEFVEGARDGVFLIKAMEKAGKPFPEEAALLLTKQFAKGLAAAHKKNIVHRDVKPENVLVPPDEQKLVGDWVIGGDRKQLIKGLQNMTGLKVADFGLAGVRSQTIRQEMSGASVHAQKVVSDQHTLTGDNSIIGTLYYIPPEGYADAQSAGKPWDVYSLGLVFYAFLTGHEDPLQYSKGIKRGKETPMSYAMKIGGDQNKRPAIADEDPFIKQLIERDPRNKRIVKMLQKMTAFDPAERPTFEEVLAWIDEELDKRSEKTLRAKKAEKQAEVASKGKRKASLIAGGVGVALLGLLASIPVINKGQRRDEFLKGHTKSLQDAEGLISSRQWNEAIALLNAEIKKVEDNEDLSGEEQQTKIHSLQQKLQTAQAELEANRNALRLISEADELVISEDFDGARAKYREAQELDAVLTSTTALKLREVNEKECRNCFESGMKAFQQGNGEEMITRLDRVKALRSVGLSPEEKESIVRMLENKDATGRSIDAIETSVAQTFSESPTLMGERLHEERHRLIAALQEHSQYFDANFWSQLKPVLETVYANPTLDDPRGPRAFLGRLMTAGAPEQVHREVLGLLEAFRSFYMNYRHYAEQLVPVTNGSEEEMLDTLVRDLQRYRALKERFRNDFFQPLPGESLSRLYSSPRFLIIKRVYEQLKLLETQQRSAQPVFNHLLAQFGGVTAFKTFLEENFQALLDLSSRDPAVQSQRASFLMVLSLYSQTLSARSGASSETMESGRNYLGSLPFLNQLSATVLAAPDNEKQEFLRLYEEVLSMMPEVDPGTRRAFEDLKREVGR